VTLPNHLKSAGQSFPSIPKLTVPLALLRGSSKPHIKARLKKNYETNVVAPLRTRLTGPDTTTRAPS